MLPIPQRFDVVIAAGNRRASRSVLGTNKIMLPVAGAPVITHVLSAVERAECTDRIFVVGDVRQLEQALASPHSPFQGLRPLRLIEQYNTFYENVWEGFLHTLPDYDPRAGWQIYRNRPEADKAALFMSGDIPVATPQEIEAFAAACDLSRFDYFLGVSPESMLRAYYPRQSRPGIRMAYFTLRNLRIRQNNLHLVRPFRLGNRFYIEKMYEYRYQKEWHNIAKLCWVLFGKQRGSWRFIAAFLRLHAAGLLTRYGLADFRPTRPFFLDLRAVCSLLSQLLDTRFAIVNTPHGGCTLDIDNAEHYAAICANFTAWLSHQEALDRELQGNPFETVSA
jgi:CTP:molybdopterin cytidylyltransferase MocA